MKIFTIKDLGNGWYDYTGLPQDQSYIKIHALHSQTDKKARNQANRILKLNGFNETDLKLTDICIVHEVLRPQS